MRAALFVFSSFCLLPLAFCLLPSVSEEELEGELNLARGAGVARLEARVGDDSEIADVEGAVRVPVDLRDATGLAEVRVVEEVEELGAELHAHGLGQVRVLDDREVRVVEARADDD